MVIQAEDQIVLNAQDIRLRLPADARNAVASLDVFAEVDSTNDWLAKHDTAAKRLWRVAVADVQTQGRGRGGNRWELPAGAGICLSMSCERPANRPNIAPLTLVIGHIICEALRGCGVTEAQVKWPNDIIAGDRKVAGILTELPRANHLVIGVGMNVKLPADFAVVREPGTLAPGDLVSAGLQSEFEDRNLLAAALISTVQTACHVFANRDLDDVLATWAESDYLAGKRVRCTGVDASVEGEVTGIAADGTLQVKVARGDTRSIASGSIYLAEAP